MRKLGYLGFLSLPLALACSDSESPSAADASARDAATSTRDAATVDSQTPEVDAATSESAGAGGSTGGAGGSAEPSGGSGGAAADSCQDALLCDDFEGAILDSARWKIVMPDCMGSSMARLALDTGHSGAHSVQIAAGGNYCDHVFIEPQLELPSSGPLYGRFYVRLGTALGASHVTFLTLRTTAEDDKGLRLGGQSGVMIWNRASDDATLPELSPTGIAASVAIAANTWTCVEFAIDDATPVLSTWVDGELVPGLQAEGAATPDIDAQWLRKTPWLSHVVSLAWGWESYGGAANMLWFDDIALGTQRIGCE